MSAMNPKFGNSLTHDSPSSHTQIYPVLDSKIGGKVQWVPKKTGVAVMKSSELGDNIVPKPPG
ncbi:uncharacterized protein G2W53_039842 [Senna tora]|uniref:Uncharacterized protein n=1 Tax=Senna tora TaxID=362788 RepID=A0A834W6H9_9FABA|nr:uncharacterized protein G2W53_039842 [Senna tora]